MKEKKLPKDITGDIEMSSDEENYYEEIFNKGNPDEENYSEE